MTGKVKRPNKDRAGGRRALRIAAAILALCALAVGCDRAVLAARQAKIDREIALDISLQNIELVEIYYNPSLKGSVAVDRQTGVMYWFGQDGGCTPLVDVNGRPRIWRQ